MIKGLLRHRKHQLSQIQDKKWSKRAWIIFGAFAFLVVGIVFGYYYCVYEYTGLLPWEGNKSFPLPPDVNISNQTIEDITEFLESDKTDELKSEEHFNCVDYSFMVMRNAQWEGLIAYAVEIDYETSPNHMVIAFPTNDSRLVMYEPQNDRMIYPQIGRDYDGKKVIGIYLINLSFSYIPLGESPPKSTSILE